MTTLSTLSVSSFGVARLASRVCTDHYDLGWIHACRVEGCRVHGLTAMLMYLAGKHPCIIIIM